MESCEQPEQPGAETEQWSKESYWGILLQLENNRGIILAGLTIDGGKLLVIKSPKSSRGMGTLTRFVCHPPSSSSSISALAACSV